MTPKSLPRFCIATLLLILASMTAPSSAASGSSFAHQIYLPLVSVPPPVPISSVIYRDDFSNSASGWPNLDTPNVRYAYTNGEYQILVRPTDAAAIATSGFSAKDFTIQVDARFASSSTAYFGIAFDISADGQSFYLLSVANYGDAHLYRVVNGDWTFLSADSISGFSPSLTHHLVVAQTGDFVSGYVDGAPVAASHDRTLTSGRAGLAALTDNQANADVRFDNFVVYNAMTWIRRADMPVGLVDFGAAVAGNGKTYTFGGFPTGGDPAVSSVEAFDPIANTWTMKKPMPTARANAGVAVAADGSIYVIGGNPSVDGWPTSTVERYDPTTDTWTTRTPMPTARSSLGLARSVDGKIYAIGGNTGFDDTTEVATVEIYDPTTDTWTTGPSLPIATYDFATVVGPDSSIYVIGGCCTNTGAFGLSNVYALKPGANSWTRLSDLPYGFLNPSAVTASNNKIYVVGGSFTGYGPNTPDMPNSMGGFVQEFDPITNAWTVRAASPYPYGQVAVFAGNGKIEILGACQITGALPCTVTGEGTLPTPGTLPDLSAHPADRPSPGHYLMSAPSDR